MRFWWVNHKQTARQEIEGRYLWSPKSEANGVRSQFYDNMRVAAPGDFVLSYANGLVGHAGLVANYPLTAPKPESFGSVGSYWSDEGWLLPMRWLPLPLPIPPKTILKQIAPLLPEKYSPLRAETGDGNQKAYFSEIDSRLFTLVAGLGGVTDDVLKATASEEVDFITQINSVAQSVIEQDIDRPPSSGPA